MNASITYIDTDTGCTIVLASPTAQPVLWREYLLGAETSYAKYGIEHVLDIAGIERGASTAIFAVAIVGAGKVVGGVRIQGPHLSVEDSHALVEWAGQPGFDDVRDTIAGRLPHGVAEFKSAWVADDRSLRGRLTKTLARAVIHSMTLLDVRFGMATSASHVIEQWATSGGRIDTAIPATPYPDARYDTRIMWWDRLSIAEHADCAQYARIRAEQMSFSSQIDELGEFAC